MRTRKMHAEFNLKIATNLKRIRRERGIPLKAAVERLGFKNHASVVHLESARTRVRATEVAILKSFYGVSYEEIFE